MKQKLQDELQTYEQQLLQRLQSAQQRAQQARDEQMYYHGQADAFSDLLSGMRNFSVEFGQDISSPLPQTPPVTAPLAAPAPEETISASPTRRGRRKKDETTPIDQMPLEATPKRRGRKPAAPPVPQTPSQILAREAIDLEVIGRRASWFYHELLPQGLIKGLQPLEKMLEESVIFREAIQAACEKKKAFVPEDDSTTIEEAVIEQPEEAPLQAAPEEPSAITVEPAPEQAAAEPEKKRRRRAKQEESSPNAETTPKKRGRKPASHPVPKVSEFQQLAREAVDLGIFTRKASWFYHKLLPQGIIKGLYQLEKLLEHDTALREAIQTECAAKKAFVPAEEPLPVSEPIRESVTEPFQEAA